MPTTRTANDLVMAVGRSLGLFHPGETPAASDAIAILEAIQDLLAEWSDGGLLVPCSVTEAVTLVINQASYTIGENGSPSLDTVRPEQITSVFHRTGGNDYPVSIIDRKAYNSFFGKTTTGRPEYLYPEYTVPNMTIYLYPVPDAVASLYITSNKPFLEPANLTEDLMATTQLPRNYFNALRYNVALDVAPMFNMEPSQTVVARAIQTKRVITALNAARRSGPVFLEIAGGGRSGGTILSY